MHINLTAAWIGFTFGCLAGAIPGLFFHGVDWLGGYASWRRRLIRLAHISFFGIGLLNAVFVFTARTLALDSGLTVPSILLIVGAVTMPLVCYLSAWKEAVRHAFFIPATSVTLAVAWFTWGVITS